MRTVAALFVATDGCYFGLPDVDPWDVRRDARLYAGTHPVVAHPPCQLWVNFAALNFKRYGGEHNRPGNDGGCFSWALSTVQRWGGVLEHPAFTNAYRAFGIGKPTAIGWNWLGSLPAGRRRLDVRSLAERLRPSRAQEDMALLRWSPPTRRARLAKGGGHRSSRMVRPDQADPVET